MDLRLNLKHETGFACILTNLGGAIAPPATTIPTVLKVVYLESQNIKDCSTAKINSSKRMKLIHT